MTEFLLLAGVLCSRDLATIVSAARAWARPGRHRHAVAHGGLVLRTR